MAPIFLPPLYPIVFAVVLFQIDIVPNIKNGSSIPNNLAGPDIAIGGLGFLHGWPVLALVSFSLQFIIDKTYGQRPFSFRECVTCCRVFLSVMSRFWQQLCFQNHTASFQKLLGTNHAYPWQYAILKLTAAASYVSIRGDPATYGPTSMATCNLQS